MKTAVSFVFFLGVPEKEAEQNYETEEEWCNK
jgi:hypothetical protein